MSTLKNIRALAAELLELENTFGANREPPNERVAAKWLRLTSDFRAAHGLPRGYPGSHRRGILRMPTNARVQCRLPSGKVEAQCTALGYGGVGLSLPHSNLDVGTRLEITEVEHLGKNYQLALAGEVRWVQAAGAQVQAGVRFDTEGSWPRDTFSAWYWAVYHEYLRALASGESVKPLIASEGSRIIEDDDAPPRMLIVDDEPENLKLLERAFRGHFEIFTASDGASALDVALRVRPQVVITDQRMPEATGVQLLSKLRWQLPDTLRILITGYVHYETLVDAVNLAMVHHYVEKPVHIESLMNAVTALCVKRLRRAGTHLDVTDTPDSAAG